MRRRKLLVALAGLAVVAAGAVVLWPEPPSRITRENFDRMRSRKLLVLLSGPAVVAAGAIVLWPRPSQVTLENCQRIREGMIRFDVELILRGPQGDYRTRPTWGGPDAEWLEDLDEHSSVVCNDRYVAHWRGDGILLIVVYDGYGRVLSTFYQCVGAGTPSVLDTWKWRFKRLWHRWFPE
jgi:hypothetical protein